MLQNFNPINIHQKVDSEDEQLMINFTWEVCIPFEFATEIYKSPNYQILADPKLTYQKANQIVKKWIVSYDKKAELCKKIAENFKSIHYVYSSLYPKVYSRINQFGIKNKSEFDLAFTYYKVQKQTNNNLKQTNRRKTHLQNFIKLLLITFLLLIVIKYLQYIKEQNLLTVLIYIG